MEVIIIIRGPQGCGKTTLATALRAWFGALNHFSSQRKKIDVSITEVATPESPARA